MPVVRTDPEPSTAKVTDRPVLPPDPLKPE